MLFSSATAKIFALTKPLETSDELRYMTRVSSSSPTRDSAVTSVAVAFVESNPLTHALSGDNVPVKFVCALRIYAWRGHIMSPYFVVTLEGKNESFPISISLVDVIDVLP